MFDEKDKLTNGIKLIKQLPLVQGFASLVNKIEETERKDSTVDARVRAKDRSFAICI